MTVVVLGVDVLCAWESGVLLHKLFIISHSVFCDFQTKADVSQ